MNNSKGIFAQQIYSINNYAKKLSLHVYLFNYSLYICNRFA